MKLGLLGEKLGHSYSPQIHRMLSDCDYGLYEIPPESVGTFLTATELDGLNVTIPYKKTVLGYCTTLSDTARRLGCANTLVKRTDGWYGDNTDYAGFCGLVRHSGAEIADRKALVLGSGGASNTACAALKDLGAAEVTVISRTGADNYGNLHRHADAEIIVNTTPVGMYPGNGGAPLSLKNFPKLEAVLDVIYNPSRTALMLEAEELGIKNAGGLYMLVEQARRSSELFNNNTVDASATEEIASWLSAEMQNIILTGMPGAGKTTKGAMLAERLGREFIDTDALIEQLAGKSIPAIFAESGEAGFRSLETQVLAGCGKLSGKVISAGGGCVTRRENYRLLHQNGVIVWIKRDVAELPSEGRPLSEAHTPGKLYEQRKHLYKSFADIEINNDVSADAAVEEMLQKLSRGSTCIKPLRILKSIMM